jgi:hypothetical protein
VARQQEAQVRQVGVAPVQRRQRRGQVRQRGRGYRGINFRQAGDVGRRRDRQREAIPAPGHRAHGRSAEQLAQVRDLHAQVVFFHHQAGPDLGQQFVLADDAVAAFDEHQQQVEGARAQRHRLAAVQHNTLIRTHLEVPERVVGDHQALPLAASLRTKPDGPRWPRL